MSAMSPVLFTALVLFLCDAIQGKSDVYLECPQSWSVGCSQTLTCTVNYSRVQTLCPEQLAHDMHFELNRLSHCNMKINHASCTGKLDGRGCRCRADNGRLIFEAIVNITKDFKGGLWQCDVPCQDETGKQQLTYSQSESCNRPVSFGGKYDVALKCPETWSEGSNETLKCTVNNTLITDLCTDDMGCYVKFNLQRDDSAVNLYCTVHTSDCSEEEDIHGCGCKIDSDSLLFQAQVVANKSFEGGSWQCDLIIPSCGNNGSDEIILLPSDSCMKISFSSETSGNGVDCIVVVATVLSLVAIVVAMAVTIYLKCYRKRTNGESETVPTLETSEDKESSPL